MGVETDIYHAIDEIGAALRTNGSADQRAADDTKHFQTNVLAQLDNISTCLDSIATSLATLAGAVERAEAGDLERITTE